MITEPANLSVQEMFFRQNTKIMQIMFKSVSRVPVLGITKDQTLCTASQLKNDANTQT